MSSPPSLDALWEAVPAPQQSFDPAQIVGLPEPVRRYLLHTLTPGAPLASAVRLRMHGEFHLNNEWCPFTAEQVNRWDGEFLWRATMHLHGLPIQGFDSLLDGKGEMKWKLFGLFPVAKGEGPDVTRSAVGRFAGEAIWLPSLLCHEDIVWTAPDTSHAHASVSILGEKSELHLKLDETGRLTQIRYPRWGNPEGGAFHYADFGGYIEEEGAFGGCTIPTRVRVGWYAGTERFDTEGEFIRVSIDEAIYR